MTTLSEPNKAQTASEMASPPNPDDSSSRGKKRYGQLWMAALCIGLSNLVSVFWLWSLIAAPLNP